MSTRLGSLAAVASVLLLGSSAVASAQSASVPPIAQLAIARSDPHGGTEILVIRADGSGARTVFHHPGPATVGDMTWSPDGRSLAFDLGVRVTVGPIVEPSPGPGVRPEPDHRWETHVVAPEAGADVQLHTDLPSDADPTWLGDGTLVTHTWPAGADWGPRELHHWTASGDAAPAIEVPDGRLVTQVYPSPSGDRFAATALAPHDFDDARLLLFDTRTLARSVLGEGTRSQPHWSPDGRWIVQANSRGDDARLVVLDTWEGTVRDLTLPGAFPTCDRTCSVIWPVAWTPDGSRVVAEVSSDGVSQILTIDRRAESLDPYQSPPDPQLASIATWRGEGSADPLPGPVGGPLVVRIDAEVYWVADDGASAVDLTERFTDGRTPIAVTPDGVGLVVTDGGGVTIEALDDGRTMATLVAPGPEVIDAVAFR